MLRLFVLSALVAFAAAIPAGVPMLDGRIVGGEATTIEDYPHQISLQWHGSHICGGTVIGSNMVITAAHCTDGSSPSSLSVRAGSSIKHSGGQVVDVRAINQHKDYNPRTIDYDISVLILASHLSMGSAIRPANIAHTEPAPGTQVTVTGWGALTEGGSSPSQLQKVHVSAISRQECNNAYGSITTRMLCAYTRGKDSCQGDSGGPLVDQSGTLNGVVSWGYGCARPNYPGVYASVPFFKEWIAENSY